MARNGKSELGVRRILECLSQLYPAVPGLIFHNTFELLVASMLSAQSTDVQVNRLTPQLFARFPDVESLAASTAEEVQPLIQGCGLFVTKSRNLVNSARMLLDKFGGQVPQTREELTQLPGVGRKTANVVLNNAFGIPALAVDTHVFRVSNRLGLANSKRIDHTEDQLTRAIPRELWGSAHHWLIWHGRKVCTARKPRCQECPISEWCDYFQGR